LTGAVGLSFDTLRSPLSLELANDEQVLNRVPESQRWNRMNRKVKDNKQLERDSGNGTRTRNHRIDSPVISHFRRISAALHSHFNS
jgi:hypothetical protein